MDSHSYSQVIHAIASDSWPELLVAVSVVSTHMALPNHWIFFSLVSRAQKWSLAKTLLITACGGMGHILSTAFLTFVLAQISKIFLSETIYKLISSLLLISVGIYFVYLFFKGRHLCIGHSHNPEALVGLTDAESPPYDGDKYHHLEGNFAGGSTVENPAVCSGNHVNLYNYDCNHLHQKQQESIENPESPLSKKPWAIQSIEISLILIPTFSPCVGSMPLLMEAQANLPLVLIVMLITAVVVLCSLVTISYYTAASINLTWLEKYERLIIGFCLILLGFVSFFLHHDHDENLATSAAP